MATKQRARGKNAPNRAPAAAEIPAATAQIPPQLQDFLTQTSIPKSFVNSKQIGLVDLRERVDEINIKPTVSLQNRPNTVNRFR